MNITYMDMPGESLELEVDLPVSVVGSVITVSGDSVWLGGQEVVLPEDQDFDVGPPPVNDTEIVASLAHDVMGDAVVLLVDEMDVEGGERMYHFDDGLYTKYLMIYSIKIAGGLGDLDAVNIVVRRRVPT